MKESCDDGITVPIAYEPRLARVLLNEEQAKAIEKYYRECAVEGSTDEQIEKSKRAMSQIRTILSHPEVIKKLAFDLAQHYDKLCAEKPKVVQKIENKATEKSIFGIGDQRRNLLWSSGKQRRKAGRFQFDKLPVFAPVV